MVIDWSVLRGESGGGGGGSVTTLTSQTVDDGTSHEIASDGYEVGQSFTIPAEHNNTEAYSIVLDVNAYNSGCSLEFRLDDDTDLSDAPLVTQTSLDPGSAGPWTIDLTGESLTWLSQKYYFIVQNANTNDVYLARDWDAYANGEYEADTDKDWLFDATQGYDLYFDVKGVK